MKKYLSMALAMLLLLAGCSSDTISAHDDSAEPTIATSGPIIMTTATPPDPSVESEPTVASDEQDFDLTAFIENVIFDTAQEPKMYIQIGDSDFYSDIDTALQIKDVLCIQSWESVPKESIPYGAIESPISLHNGNHPASEIIIDTERHYAYVTVYNTDSPQGVDNVHQYPYSLGESVIKNIQALVDELKAAAQ